MIGRRRPLRYGGNQRPLMKVLRHGRKPTGINPNAHAFL